jgi:chromosomal replication initiator protein
VVKDDSDRLSVMRDALRRRLGGERYELWLGERTQLEFAGNTLRVVCASQAELQFSRRNLHRPLAECCVALWSPPPSIVFEEAASAPSAGAPRNLPGPRPRGNDDERPVAASPPAPRASTRTFETFALGASNRIAVQAARDLAHHPGRFSPLLLHGPVGCGKSHLLDAVHHGARAARGRLRSISLTAEQFTAQFLDALNSRGLPGFRHKLRGIDLLLVDDVQFFDGKRATLEELLYTLDALHNRDGQVVLTSDRAPADLAAISPELASRLAGGLAVELFAPDLTVRVGIVRSLALRMRLALADDVVNVVARQVVGSARLLSGALNRIVAASMAAAQPVTAEFAEAAVIAFCGQHTPQVRLPDIQRAVCELFGVEPAALRSARRNRSSADPRMLCMWLARRYTRAALSEIGDFFGGRKHSTVVSAKRKVDELIDAGGEVTLGDRPYSVEEVVRRIEARLRTG